MTEKAVCGAPPVVHISPVTRSTIAARGVGQIAAVVDDRRALDIADRFVSIGAPSPAVAYHKMTVPAVERLAAPAKAMLLAHVLETGHLLGFFLAPGGQGEMRGRVARAGFRAFPRVVKILGGPGLSMTGRTLTHRLGPLLFAVALGALSMTGRIQL